MTSSVKKTIQIKTHKKLKYERFLIKNATKISKLQTKKYFVQMFCIYIIIAFFFFF